MTISPHQLPEVCESGKKIQETGPRARGIVKPLLKTMHHCRRDRAVPYFGGWNSSLALPKGAYFDVFSDVVHVSSSARHLRA
jgi:hypothetical protein